MNGQYVQSSIKEQYTPRWDQMSFQTNSTQFKFPTTEYSSNYQANPSMIHPSHHNGYSPTPMQISSALKKSIDPMSPRGESKNFLDENSLDATFLNFINNTREDYNKDILNSNRKANGMYNGINNNNYQTNIPFRPTSPAYQTAAAAAPTTVTVAPLLPLSPQIQDNILTTNRFNQLEQTNKTPQVVSVQSPSSNSGQTSWAYSQIMQKYSTQPVAAATSTVPSGGIQVNDYKPMLTGNENNQNGIPPNYGLRFQTQTPVDVLDYSTNVVNKVGLPQSEQIKYISNQSNNSTQPPVQGFRDAVLLAFPQSAIKVDNRQNYQSTNTGTIKTEPDIPNYESVMKKYMPQSPERIVSHSNFPDDLSSRKSSVSARVIGIQKSGNRDGSRDSRPIATSKELLKNFSSVLFSPSSQVMPASQLQVNSNYSQVKQQQQQQQQIQQPQRILGQGNLRELPSTSSETTANPFQQTNRDFTLVDNSSYHNNEKQKYQQQQQQQLQQQQQQQQQWQKQINPMQDNGSQYRQSIPDRFGQIPLYITQNEALNSSEKRYQQSSTSLINAQPINKGVIFNGGSSSLETPPHQKAMSINPIDQESILSRYSSQKSVKTEPNQGGRSDSQSRTEEGKRQIQLNGIEAEYIQTPTSRASYSSQYASNRVPLTSIVPTVAFQLKAEKSKFNDHSNSHYRLNSDSSGKQIPTVQSIDQVVSHDQSMLSENNQSGLFRVKMNHGESMTSNAPSNSILESQNLINPSPVGATNAIKDLIRTIKTEELDKFPRQININNHSNFGSHPNNKEGNQFLKPQVAAAAVQNGQPINQNMFRPIVDQLQPVNVPKGVQVFCIHCNRFFQQNEKDLHQCSQKDATLKMLLDEEWKIDQQLVEILGKLSHSNQLQSSVHYKNELTRAIYQILERKIQIPVLQRETRLVIMINQTMAGYSTQESKPALALGQQVESLVKRKVDIRMKMENSSNQIATTNNNNNNMNINQVDVYNLSNQQSPSMKSNIPLSQRDFQSPLQTQTTNRLSTAFSPRSPEGVFSKTMNSFQTNQSAFNLRNGSDTESRGNFSEKNFYSGENNYNNRLNNFARDRNLQSASRDVLLGNGDGRSLSNNSQAFTEKGERSNFGTLQGERQVQGITQNLNNQFETNQRINPNNFMIKPKFQQIFQRSSVSPSQGLRIVPTSQQPFKQVQLQQQQQQNQQNQIVQPKPVPFLQKDSANISSQRTHFYSLALTAKLRLPIGHPGNQVDLLNMFNAAVSQNVPQQKYFEFITSYFQNMK